MFADFRNQSPPLFHTIDGITPDFPIVRRDFIPADFVGRDISSLF